MKKDKYNMLQKLQNNLTFLPTTSHHHHPPPNPHQHKNLTSH